MHAPPWMMFPPQHSHFLLLLFLPRLPVVDPARREHPGELCWPPNHRGLFQDLAYRGAPLALPDLEDDRRILWHAAVVEEKCVVHGEEQIFDEVEHVGGGPENGEDEDGVAVYPRGVCTVRGRCSSVVDVTAAAPAECPGHDSPIARGGVGRESVGVPMLEGVWYQDGGGEDEGTGVVGEAAEQGYAGRVVGGGSRWEWGGRGWRGGGGGVEGGGGGS